jgi:D-proline reductase (dithiol) PrdB
MISERVRGFDFAAASDVPIRYLERTRTYYAALGFGAPYQWAHCAQVPFHRLEKPLSRCRLTIITTAAPFQPGKGDQAPGAPYNGAAKFFTVYSGDTAKDHDLRISHIAIDRKHTTAADPATYFPLTELRRRAARGDIAPLASRFHGLPTNRSHRVTLEVDCPEIVDRCRADQVDAALLWSGSPDWKLDYCNIERVPAEEIAQRRAEFEQQKNLAKAVHPEVSAGSSQARG